MDNNKTEPEAASALAQLLPEVHSKLEALTWPQRAVVSAVAWTAIAATVMGVVTLTAGLLVVALLPVVFELLAPTMLWTLAVLMGGRRAWA